MNKLLSRINCFILYVYYKLLWIQIIIAYNISYYIRIIFLPKLFIYFHKMEMFYIIHYIISLFYWALQSFLNLNSNLTGASGLLIMTVAIPNSLVPFHLISKFLTNYNIKTIFNMPSKYKKYECALYENLNTFNKVICIFCSANRLAMHIRDPCPKGIYKKG